MRPAMPKAAATWKMPPTIANAPASSITPARPAAGAIQKMTPSSMASGGPTKASTLPWPSASAFSATNRPIAPTATR